MSELQWLIERGQPEGQTPTVWYDHTTDRWTTDARGAAMFPTRVTAEDYIYEHFTHPVRGASARAVEHGFMSRTTTEEKLAACEDLLTRVERVARTEADPETAVVLILAYFEAAALAEDAPAVNVAEGGDVPGPEKERTVDFGIRLPRGVTAFGVSYVVEVSPDGFRFALRGPAESVAREYESLALDFRAQAAHARLPHREEAAPAGEFTRDEIGLLIDGIATLIGQQRQTVGSRAELEADVDYVRCAPLLSRLQERWKEGADG